MWVSTEDQVIYQDLELDRTELPEVMLGMDFSLCNFPKVLQAL